MRLRESSLMQQFWAYIAFYGIKLPVPINADSQCPPQCLRKPVTNKCYSVVINLFFFFFNFIFKLYIIVLVLPNTFF